MVYKALTAKAAANDMSSQFTLIAIIMAKVIATVIHKLCLQYRLLVSFICFISIVISVQLNAQVDHILLDFNKSSCYGQACLAFCRCVFDNPRL